MGSIRAVQELAAVQDPAWPQIVEWAVDGGRTQILEREPTLAEQPLFRLLATTLGDYEGPVAFRVTD